MKFVRIILGASVLLLAACQQNVTVNSGSSPSPSASPTPDTVQVSIKDANGNTVGTATFQDQGSAGATSSSPTARPSSSANTSPSPTPTPAASGSAATGTGSFSQGVTITIQITNLSPGTHAMHVHAVGRCDAPAFTTAGAHFNPSGAQHGVANPRGPHAGDLPSLTVGPDKTAYAQFKSNMISLRQGDPTSLRRPDGASLVIHAGVDDEVSDPAGNSGARVACGVITPASGGSPAPTSSATGTATSSPSAGASASPRPTATPTPSPSASPTR